MEIPGAGGLHDLNAVARHFYYQGKRENDKSPLPLAFMGAVTVALGCSMVWGAYQKSQGFAAKAAGARGRGR